MLSVVSVVTCGWQSDRSVEQRKSEGEEEGCRTAGLRSVCAVDICSHRHQHIPEGVTEEGNPRWSVENGNLGLSPPIYSAISKEAPGGLWFLLMFCNSQGMSHFVIMRTL